jgi:lipid-binding SYLF domain-containing protein
MRVARPALVLVLAWIAVAIPWPALMAEAQTLDEEVESALRELLETTPAARNLWPTAKGIVVFPNIFRENYAFGVQSGYGALITGGKIVSYYSTTSIAYGLQAGVLPFGYALFLMTEAALARLGQANGWNVGRDPGVAILSTGTPEKADAMDTQGGTMDATGGTMSRRPTARTDTYAFILGDEGLMTGVGMEGWSIVRVTP